MLISFDCLKSVSLALAYKSSRSGHAPCKNNDALQQTSQVHYSSAAVPTQLNHYIIHVEQYKLPIKIDE